MSDMPGNLSLMTQPKRFTSPQEWKEWIDAELQKEPVTVATDKGAKGAFESLSISYVRVRMLEIFGLSYSEEVTLVAHALHKVQAETARGKKYEAFTAWGTAKSRVVIALPWGTVVREGLGVCDCVNRKTPKDAIDMAFKGAASDAFKVACRSLGRTFGIELRLKEEELRALEDQREQEPEDRADQPADPWGERGKREERPANDEPRNNGRGYERERTATDRRADDSRRSLEGQREAAFGPDRSTPVDNVRDPRNPNWDPELEDLLSAGFDRGMARGLATLPPDKQAPRETLQELWDMGSKLFEGQGGEADPYDQLWQLVESLKIDEKNVRGSDARRIAVGIMLATKPKERSRS